MHADAREDRWNPFQFPDFATGSDKLWVRIIAIESASRNGYAMKCDKNATMRFDLMGIRQLPFNFTVLYEHINSYSGSQNTKNIPQWG